MNSFKYFFYNDNNKANLFFIEDVININVNKTNNEVKCYSVTENENEERNFQ